MTVAEASESRELLAAGRALGKVLIKVVRAVLPGEVSLGGALQTGKADWACRTRLYWR